MSVEQKIRDYILDNYLFTDDQSALADEDSFLDKGIIDSTGIMDYGSLMYIALQRAKSAREAIQVVGDLVKEYGGTVSSSHRRGTRRHWS